MGPAAIVAGKLLAVLAKSCVWPVGQAVKTRPFHGCNMGSIPVRVTKQKHLLKCGRCFYFSQTYKDVNHVGDPCGNRTARAARSSSRAATTPLRGVVRAREIPRADGNLALLRKNYECPFKDVNRVGDPCGNRTARAARLSSRAATTPLRGVGRSPGHGRFLVRAGALPR